MSNTYILVATYDGRRFLPEQIISILKQSHSDFSLYFRDDISSDETVDVIESFMSDDRVSVLSSSENLGVTGCFEKLLYKALMDGAENVFLSDQDDVWVINKLSEQLELMKDLELKHPKLPLLIHADLEVVDASLTSIAPSMIRYQGIKHESVNPLNVLLAQNFVTGCTVLINRALLEVALPIPKEALMHDWWLALCAAVFGEIEYIDKPLVKYRQHGNNEVGAKPLGGFINPFSGKWLERWLEGRDNLFQSMKQAEVLAKRIRKYNPKNQYLELVEAYAELYHLPPLKRINRLHELGVHAQSNRRQGLLLSRLLLTSKGKYG